MDLFVGRTRQLKGMLVRAVAIKDRVSVSIHKAREHAAVAAIHHTGHPPATGAGLVEELRVQSFRFGPCRYELADLPVVINKHGMIFEDLDLHYRFESSGHGLAIP